MLKLLIKTLGYSFYKQHVGLFLVLFYLLFGMIQGYDLIHFHQALLISICSSVLNFGLLFLVWLLYACKCLFFIKQKLASTDHHFIKEMTVMPVRKQQVLWIKVFAFLLLPILLYAICLLLTAIWYQFYINLLIVPLCLFLLMAFLVVYTFRFTNWSFQVAKKWIAFPMSRFKRPFWLWPLAYLFQQQWLMLVIVKVVSLLSFKAVLWVFADVGNDLRVYLTAMLAVVFSHAVLLFNLVKFDAFYLSFAKNLPMVISKRFGYWLLVFVLLLVPEFTVLLGLGKLGALQLIHGFLFSMAAMWVMFTAVYLFKADMERYMKYLLFFFFASMWAILAGYSLWFSLLLFLLASIGYFWRYRHLDLKTLA